MSLDEIKQHIANIKSKERPDDDLALANLMRELSITPLITGVQYDVKLWHWTILKIYQRPIGMRQLNQLTKMLYKLQEKEQEAQEKAVPKGGSKHGRR